VGENAGIFGPTALITDPNVGPLYAESCQTDHVITLPAGEQYKTLASVQTIYDALLAANLDRKGSLLALGGGVIGDVTGFAAATYLRGLPFVQLPTSLLAMVDASVGGKTGVDLPQGKNLVGAFKQPAAVLADVVTLQTLPALEFSAGMAEVIKHGLLAAPALLHQIETTGQTASPIALRSLLLRAIQVKQQVVEADPYEQGRRATLNLGHTFAHAIEQVSHYAIRHGEAVGMGLVAAADLSARLGHANPALTDQIRGWLAQVGLPTAIPAHLPPTSLLAAMQTDKKKDAGKMRYVLLRAIGDPLVTDQVSPAAVVETLQAISLPTNS